MSRRTYRFARGVLLGAVLTGAAATVVHLNKRPDVAPPDFMGHAVTIDTAATGSVLDVRTGCRISAFGVAPWLARGKPKDFTWERATRRALLEMGLTPADVDQAVAKLRAGRADATVGMGDTYGVTSAGQFILPTFSTTYRVGERYTVCHGSQTRFGNTERQEFATVYRVGGVLIGEFLACGNVTRFEPAPHGWVPPLPPGAAVPPDSGSGPGAQVPPPAGAAVNKVPEPGTLVLIALALVGLFVSRTKD